MPRDVDDVPEAGEPVVRQSDAGRHHLGRRDRQAPLGEAGGDTGRHGGGFERGGHRETAESIACPLDREGSPPPAMASSPVVV